MCAISGAYDKVHNTKLFGARLNDKEQLTVYSNAIQAQNLDDKHPIVMVLPVPLYKGTSADIKMTEIKSDFFTLLDDHMRPPATRGMSRGAFSFGAAKLPVHQCGNYQYSVVPTCDDFLKIDEETLPLDAAIKQTMKDHYGKDYAFLVCKMMKGTGQYSPLGYIHPANPDETTRLPTVHVHHNQPKEYMAHDWDHAIYTTAPMKARNELDNTEGNLNHLRAVKYLEEKPSSVISALDKSASCYSWSSNVDWKQLRMYAIEGTYRNIDVFA